METINLEITIGSFIKSLNDWILQKKIQRYLWIPDCVLNREHSTWGWGFFFTLAWVCWQVLLLATLLISQFYAAEDWTIPALSDGPRHGQSCQKTQSGDTKASTHNWQDTEWLRFQCPLAINYSFHIGFGLWVYHAYPSRWYEEYRCVLANSKVRSMEGKASGNLPEEEGTT